MTLVLAIRLVAAAVALTLQGFPPNLVENGDARGGPSGWQPVPGHQRPRKDLSRDAMIEMIDGAPCFVMRNQASWVQTLPLYEDHAGKFLLIIGRGSSERVYEDDNITGLPYLWAHLVADGKPTNTHWLQGMRLHAKTANEWGTMHGIFPVPKGVRSITLKLGQAERKGTPQNGSAARVKDVEARLFETRADAAAYVAAYNALHDSVK
jgi:hypothetical protein